MWGYELCFLDHIESFEEEQMNFPPDSASAWIFSTIPIG
jgi:hypothetical protein